MPYCFANGGVVNVDQMLDEDIRMLSLDSVRSKSRIWEVPKVHCHDHSGLGVNCGCKDVTVSRVGKRQALNEGFIPGYHAIGNSAIH